MWCKRCHNGSDTTSLKVGTRCPQCGGKFELMKSPFPERPKEGKGSGRSRKKNQEHEE